MIACIHHSFRNKFDLVYVSNHASQDIGDKLKPVLKPRAVVVTELARFAEPAGGGHTHLEVPRLLLTWCAGVCVGERTVRRGMVTLKPHQQDAFKDKVNELCRGMGCYFLGQDKEVSSDTFSTGSAVGKTEPGMTNVRLLYPFLAQFLLRIVLLSPESHGAAFCLCCVWRRLVWRGLVGGHCEGCARGAKARVQRVRVGRGHVRGTSGVLGAHSSVRREGTSETRGPEESTDEEGGSG